MHSKPRCFVLLTLLLLAVFVPTAVAQVATEVPPAAKANFELPASDDGLPGAGPIRRADWFQDLWRQRRSAFDRRAAQDQGALVFLGNSITQGWGDELARAFAGVKVANRGISGDTSRGMLIRLEEDVLALNPSGVVMLMGTNDIGDGARPEMIAGNVKLILDEFQRHTPETPIVLCLVMPSSQQMNRPANAIRELNRLYAEAAEGNPQVTVLDLWTLFANEEGDAKPQEFPDLLHPNSVGYSKWTAALRPILATLGFLETAPDLFSPEPGFRSLFNGHDLTGWCFRPTSEADIKARNDWHARDPNAALWPIVTERVDFPGQASTDDGRFVAKNGRLIVTSPTEGRRVQQLWTTEEFPHDFVLKLQFRGTPNADSGIYLRGPQLQCRDYVLAGPYTELKNYKPQDWNDIVVKVTGNTAHCTCNGEVLEAEFQVPDTGPIGVEGDRGQMEYRRIRLQELP